LSSQLLAKSFFCTDAAFGIANPPRDAYLRAITEVARSGVSLLSSATDHFIAAKQAYFLAEAFALASFSSCSFRNSRQRPYCSVLAGSDLLRL